MEPEGLKIIPEQKPEAPKWVNYALFVFVFLCLALGTFSLVLRSQTGSLEAEKTSLVSQIQALDLNPENISSEKELKKVSKKLKDFTDIYENQNLSSKFFAFLREICHPKVYFRSMDLNLNNFSVILAGQTESFQFLGEQLLVLNQREDVKGVEVSGVSLEKQGTVSFILNFEFEEQILRNYE